MSNPSIQQLYPTADSALPLKGLYLRHDLRAEAAKLDRPFVFSNFIVSLDGRIATPKTDGSGQT